LQAKQQEMPWLNIDTTHSLRFHKLHILFFLSVLKNKKNKHLARMCGGLKMLKHNVWTT